MSERISKRGRRAPRRTAHGRSDRPSREARSQQTQPPASSNTFYSQLNTSTTPEEMRDPTYPGGLPPGKMLLPPLPRSYASPKADKNRTSHACNMCRKAKAKCSGGQPCEKCRIENRECVYGEGKRDKERKEMGRLYNQNQRLTRKNEQLLNALRGLAPHLEPAKKEELEYLITSPTPDTDDDVDDQMMYRDSETKDSDGQDSTCQGEDEAAAGVGSPDSLDLNNEDTNRDERSRATGFMGKSSAVAWIQRAKEAVAQNPRDGRHQQTGNASKANGTFTASSYHGEPADFFIVGTDEVNPFEWPSSDLAKALVDSYFAHVHVAFPVLLKDDFYKIFDTFPRDHLSNQDQCSLSLINMVFAIGANFSTLADSSYSAGAQDHRVYYARARALGMDQRTLHQDPELQHLVCLAILGLYLLSTDQLNRSWTVCGIAIRHATALGLHVRNEAKDLTDVDKELRVRLWWSIYNLERLLDELTGRPTCVSDRDISTPLPINVDESEFRRDRKLYKDSPHGQHSTPTSMAFKSRLPITSSTYLIYRTQLSIISHEILTELYCAALIKAKWSDVQDTIRRIDGKLLKWKDSLPKEFDLASASPPNERIALHRTSLTLFYNSSRMTLFRPCLCRSDCRIENESARSKDFGATSAATCVEAARNVIAALPPISDPARLYRITAWWSIVHYIIEAASVLMLELAYRTAHLPSQAEGILADSKKAVIWLRSLAGQSIAARKGWEIFDNLLRQVAPRIGGSAYDMPESAPVPPRWSWNHGPTHRGDEIQTRDDIFKPQTSQSFSNDSIVATSWVDHSTYGEPQSFLAPAPSHIPTTSVFSTQSGMTQPYPRGINPFGGLYGRYDEFVPWHNVPTEHDVTSRNNTIDMANFNLLVQHGSSMDHNQMGNSLGAFDEDTFDPSGTSNTVYNSLSYPTWSGNDGE